MAELKASTTLVLNCEACDDTTSLNVVELADELETTLKVSEEDDKLLVTVVSSSLPRELV